MPNGENWAHLTDAEWADIRGLPFENAVVALLDAARPRASVADLASCTRVWGERIPEKADLKRSLANWKAARAAGREAGDDAEAQDRIPVRERLVAQLHEAISQRDNQAINRLALALTRVAAAGVSSASSDDASWEDWSRLNDTEAAMCIALVRKLNGETPTTVDAEYLAALNG